MSMKITKAQLKQIIKEELLKLQEYGGRPYDPTVAGDFERARDNITGDAPPGPPMDLGPPPAGRRPISDLERMNQEHEARRGRKFEIIKPITVELPGDVRDYQPGDIVTLQGCDKETRDGIGICWGHGGYALIPVGYYREL